jgi:hypothetical protein
MKKLIILILLTFWVGSVFSQTKPKTTDTAKDTIARTSPFRVNFDKIFRRNTDGSFSPMHPVQINGEYMGTGVPFIRGTYFGGVDIGSYSGHDMLIDTIKDVIIIRKIY